MGGASSYYAMLSICGFLTAAWAASKISRLIGVSSIVLEITTGVVFGPRAVGLIVEEYATCDFARHAKCTVPANVNELAREGHSLGTTLDHFNNHDYCDFHTYDHGHGDDHATTGDGHDDGGHADPDGQEQGGTDGHSDTAGSHEEHGSDDHSDAAGHEDSDHSHSPDGGHSADGGHRRLSGGGGVTYTSFAECLQKSCEAEVSHECGLTPDVFTLIGHAGVALMIFESGMHFDFEKAKVVGVPACCVAVVGTILPLIVGTLLMMVFGRPLMPDGISAGTALAPTSVGIALRLLGEAGVLQENFGQAIITAAFVDDILSLVLFNVLFSLGGDFDLFKTVLAPIIGIAFMLIAMVGAVKFWPGVIDGMLLPQAPDRRDGSLQGWRKIRLEKDELLFLLQIIMLVAYSMLTHLLGTHLWGCFIAGMSFACLSPPHHAHHVWVKQTKRMTTWMIRIFFSCTVAFSIPVEQLMSISAFWKGSILGIFACILTKVCCAPFMGPARWVIGWAMVGRAEFAYLIAQMALSSNMLDSESFSIVIWALLYATIFAPFIFRFLLNRYVKAQGLESKTTESAALHDHEGGEVWDEEGSTKVAPAGKKEMDFNPVEDNARDAIPAELDNRKEAKLQGGPAKSSQGTDSFLCCLFFKKVLVQ